MSELFACSIQRSLAQIACVFALTACGLAAYAREPAANPDPTRFDAEIAAFEKWDRQNSVPRDAVLFVGSSSIRLWQTAESFPDLPVINRGFGGSHISDVNHFADRIVIKYKPRLVVFYAGDNDIADGKPPQQVADDFKEFAKLVLAKLPEVRIIYLPIKPSPLRWKLWPKARQANSLAQEFTKSNPRLTYADIATPLLGANNSQPPANLFLDDGLHLNARGYDIWNETLGNVLDRVQSKN